MGVQESLNTVYAEMVNRWTKLTGTADPNTISGYDGAPIGITYVRTGTDPVVVWIKNRAGAAGWDLYNPGGTISVGGDLSGTLPNPTVDGLQGRAVAATAPADTNVLTWNAGAAQWQPAAAGGGGSARPFVVVGNQPAGDTTAVCDYLDTGNGAQLAAAITYATTNKYNVYVRPGTYNFNLASGPNTDIVIDGITVSGVPGGGDPAITARTSGYSVAATCVFELRNAGSLEYMTVSLAPPTATIPITCLIKSTLLYGTRTACRYVNALCTGTWTAASVNFAGSLVAIFNNIDTLEYCSGSSPQFYPLVSGRYIRIIQQVQIRANLWRCTATLGAGIIPGGLPVDDAVWLETSDNRISDCSLSTLTISDTPTGCAAGTVVRGTTILKLKMFGGARQCVISDCRLYMIRVTGSYNIFNGLTFYNAATGDPVVGSVTFSGAGTGNFWGVNRRYTPLGLVSMSGGIGNIAVQETIL